MTSSTGTINLQWLSWASMYRLVSLLSQGFMAAPQKPLRTKLKNDWLDDYGYIVRALAMMLLGKQGEFLNI